VVQQHCPLFISSASSFGCPLRSPSSQFQYEDVVAEQAARGGIIIIRALYGDMCQLQRPHAVDIEHLPDTIDVTIPMQILVQRSVNPATQREVMKIELSGGWRALFGVAGR
jgi:hypothetical protein